MHFYNDDFSLYGMLQPEQQEYAAELTNKTVQLHTDPHYSDPRFEKEQTVFGGAREGLLYDYSDRLIQADSTKASMAQNVADASGARRKTCQWYEAYLSAYYDAQIEIYHITAGINPSNGYSYYTLGYTKTAKESRGD